MLFQGLSHQRRGFVLGWFGGHVVKSAPLQRAGKKIIRLVVNNVRQAGLIKWGLHKMKSILHNGWGGIW